MLAEKFQRGLPPVALCCCVLLLTATRGLSAEPWQVGLAKVDITPTEPLRLSGYAVRVQSHSGVADPLSARALVLSPAGEDRFTDSVVLVSLDSIVVTSAITLEVAGWLEESHHIPRGQLVISSSHSHAAPHLSGGLKNLYPQPSTPEQDAATERYTEKVIAAIKQVVADAIESRVPAALRIGEAGASFMTNRRLLNFQASGNPGEPPVGPVDQRVRVMQFTDPAGEHLGAAFMVACHCTTMGSEFNQVSGDWAGITATRLEQLHPGTIVLPVIGCGADANPHPRGSYELAGQHAAELVTAIEQVFEREDLDSLDSFPVARFGFAGLVPEHPSPERVENLLTSDSPSERSWAEHMKKVKQRMGRLPESYPMPIHTWQFGEDLIWVFLGGEVVADYQLKLEQLLPSAKTWVAAYCDDVFAYVASERQRDEGGYEVDQSMIYYLQPGRWESGTQALIERRVSEILNQERSEDKPLTAREAIDALRVPEGFRVELVAGEPLVADPINIAFGLDGRVWLVEMADYPLGAPGGGRVKWLRDSDLDGELDEAGIFLEGLSYPTSVMPWREGVLVIAAPDVIYAEDFNGDGVADRKETLLTGIAEANPQHRASGFEIGLDGWLHFASGSGTGRIHSLRNNQTYDIHGHDVAWHPDSGEIRTTSGETQFVRARDEYGNWFGNSNSLPMYQFVIDDRYLTHGSVAGGVQQHLLEPPQAPPVHPRSRTVDRFNDQHARDRFTSACSSIVARVPGARGPANAPGNRAMNEAIGFICEPVHNLVARVQLTQRGSALSATRHPEDTEFDFLTSTDPWSRPVRVVNAPDGSLWVLDMVRRVIEHPEWIPTAWQERLDLRSGANLGRIYRVVRDDFELTPLRGFEPTAKDLLPMLASSNGVIRDLAVQELLSGPHGGLQADVRRVAREHVNPAVRASALGCMAGASWLEPADVALALQSEEPALVRLAIELVERWTTPDPMLQSALHAVVERELGPAVDLQWVLTSTLCVDLDASEGLRRIAERSRGDVWIEKAMTLVMGEKEAFAALSAILENLDAQSWESQLDTAARSEALVRLWKRAEASGLREMIDDRMEGLLKESEFRVSDVLLLSLAAQHGPVSEGIERAGLAPELAEKIRRRLLDTQAPEAERVGLVSLIGTGVDSADNDLESLDELLSEGNRKLSLAAIARAMSIGDERAGEVLLRHWNQLGSPQRSAAGSMLLRSSSWTSQLVAQLESETIRRRELDPSTIQQLRNYPQPEIHQRAVAVLGRPTARAPLVARYLQELPAEVDAQGAKAAGEKLYTEHCGVCHSAQAGRPSLGPSIENLAHWDNQQWVTAILDPNQAIEPKFQQTIVVTRDGQITAGIAIEKTSRSVRLATTDGRIQEIPLSEVDQWKQLPTSLMPEGFEEKLSPRQLAEIILYLRGR